MELCWNLSGILEDGEWNFKNTACISVWIYNMGANVPTYVQNSMRNSSGSLNAHSQHRCWVRPGGDASASGNCNSGCGNSNSNCNSKTSDTLTPILRSCYEEANVRIVGGCCRVRPSDIEDLSEEFSKMLDMRNEYSTNELSNTSNLSSGYSKLKSQISREQDPTAWVASDFPDEATWTVDISGNEGFLEELNRNLKERKAKSKEESTESAHRKFIPFSKSDFPLSDKFEEFLASNIRNHLEVGRGFVRLRLASGADSTSEADTADSDTNTSTDEFTNPFPSWSPSDHKIILWGVGLYIGWGERQDKSGSLIHEVKDHRLVQKNAEEKSNIRYFQTNTAIPFHTDGCDCFALYCLSQGRSGGQSLLASAVSVFNQILEERPDLAEVLQEDFYFDARAQHPKGKLCQVHPVFSYYSSNPHKKKLLSIIHKEPYIRSAQRFHPDTVPRLTDLQKEALAFFDQIANQDRFVLKYDMRPGDICFASNHSLIHGRTAFEDGSGDQDGVIDTVQEGGVQDQQEKGDKAISIIKQPKKRHCLRLWLTLPGARELPPHYAETREYCHGYERIKRYEREDPELLYNGRGVGG